MSPTAGSTADARAVSGLVNFNGTGSSPSAFAKGVFAQAQNSWTGTLGNAMGVHGTINAVNGGTITNAYGGYFGATSTASTITNAYGVYTGTLAGTNKWSFYASDSTAPSYFAGNVGIGTAVPVATLHLNNTTAAGLQFTNSTTGVAASDGFILGQFPSSGHFTMWNYENSDTYFGTNNTERLRILANGNVGIGTSNPTSTLTVNGGLARNLASVTTATYTVGSTDTHVVINYAGMTTVTLPSAASFPGREISIRTITANTVVSASSNVVPLAGGSAGTAILSATAGKWVLLVSDGTNWQIQMGN